jgi:hypothetical protein
MEETLSSRQETEEILKNGTSTKNLEPSRAEATTNHGTFQVQVNLPTCKFGKPTLDGGNSSSMKDNSSPISKTERYLISRETKIKKAIALLSGRDMEEETKDGRLPIPTKLPRRSRRDSTPTSDSTSTDHSTSDLDSQ